MSTWAWAGLAIAGWVALSIVAGIAVGRALRIVSTVPAAGRSEASAEPDRASASRAAPGRLRVVVVDDDPGLRALLRATLASDELELAEAANAEEARDLVRLWRPEVVLLDVAMPGLDGLSFCRELKNRPAPPAVVLVTGTEISGEGADASGANAVLTKPFSPLELVGTIDRLTRAPDLGIAQAVPEGEQLLLYARDLSRLLEVERAQRRLLETAYRQTVTALATTLEARDTGTRLHSLRVTRYALELAGQHEPQLLSDPSLVYGFLLHDIGKIGVPDRILLKDGPLDPLEWRVMQRHPLVGEEILGDVALLEGEGLRVVRSHHERWDGAGYPDGLGRDRIPAGARIFAVADALDAMTTRRPYRDVWSWDDAVAEIEEQAVRQFDPEVVETFAAAEPGLRAIYEEMSLAAA